MRISDILTLNTKEINRYQVNKIKKKEEIVEKHIP